MMIATFIAAFSLLLDTEEACETKNAWCGDSTVTLRHSAYRARTHDKVACFSWILVTAVAEQLKGLSWIRDVASELKEVLVVGAPSQ